MKKSINIIAIMVVLALGACKPTTYREYGIVQNVEKTNSGCTCLVHMQDESPIADANTMAFRCPSDTEVGDTLHFTFIKH